MDALPATSVDSSETSRAIVSKRRMPHPLALLIALTLPLLVAGALFVWLPYQREQSIVNRIRDLGGTVETEYVGPQWLKSWLGESQQQLFHRAVRIQTTDDDPFSTRFWGIGHSKVIKLTNEDLREIGEMTYLRAIDLDGAQFDPEGLASLARLTNLKSLSMRKSAITDNDLVPLAELRQLEELDLGENKVTDAGLQTLSGLAELQTLLLDRTRISDAAIPLIAAHPKLKQLSLNGTMAGGPALKDLASLSQLEYLTLDETVTNRVPVWSLQMKLPKCVITFVPLPTGL